MGRLSEYRSKNILPPQDTTAQQRVQVEARGQQAIGEAIGNIGQQVYQAGMMETRIRNRNYINETSTQMERHFNEYQQEMLKTMRQDPDIDNPGRREVYQGFLDKEYKRFMGEALKKAPNGRAAEVFSQGAENAYNSMIQANNRNFEATFIENSNAKVGERAKESALKVYRNPNLDTLNLAKAEIEAASRVFDDTMDPRLAKEARNKLYQRAAGSLLDGLIDRDRVGEASKVLKSRKLDDDLGADAVSAYRKRINSILKARKAKAKDFSVLRVRNPHEYWKKSGRPLTPLKDFSPESIGTRFFEIETKAKEDGIPIGFVKPLSNLEEESFLKIVQTQPVKESLAQIFAMRETPDDQYYKIVQQIGQKNPSLAVAMDFVKDGSFEDMNRAKDILMGEQLIKKSSFDKSSPMRMPKDKELDIYIDGLISKVNMGAEERFMLKRSLKAAYATERARQGKNGDDFDDTEQNLLKKVFKHKFGETFSWNGATYLAPKTDNGILLEEEQSTYALENINNRALLASHKSKIYDGKGVFDIENEASSRIMIYPDLEDPDLFRVVLKKRNGADVALLDKDGNYFKLDIAKLYQAVDKGIREDKGFFEKTKDLLKSLAPQGISDNPVGQGNKL